MKDLDILVLSLKKISLYVCNYQDSHKCKSLYFIPIFPDKTLYSKSCWISLTTSYFLIKFLNLVNSASGIGTPLFSCDQAALWMVQSVRLSVRLSVCPSVRPSVCLSHLFDYVPIILSSWNFQELLPVTKVTSMQKVKVRGQRSRSQRSQPNLTVSGL